MNKRTVIIAPVLLAGLMMFTACLRDDNSEELKAMEQKLLLQYLADNNITQAPTASGLYFIPEVEGDGPLAVDGDVVEIQYTGELVTGEVFSTSYDSIAKVHYLYDELYLFGPTRSKIETTLIEGIYEGLQYMKKGGKAKLIIPSDLGFGSISTSRIPSYSTLVYTIEMLNIIPDPASYERQLIQQLLADSNFLPADSTATGLYYIETVEGEGETIQDNDRVYIHCTGYFFDGRVFDTNVGEEPFEILYPYELIDGWIEGLAMMRKGSKGILVIPYWLAYGEPGWVDDYGRLRIPPYMTLIFEIEIDDIT